MRAVRDHSKRCRFEWSHKTDRKETKFLVRGILYLNPEEESPVKDRTSCNPYDGGKEERTTKVAIVNCLQTVGRQNDRSKSAFWVA